VYDRCRLGPKEEFGGKFVKKSLLFVCLLALLNLALSAQNAKDPRALHITERSAIHVPPQETPAALKQIYSNLGRSKTDLYNAGDFWGLAGPNSAFGLEFWAIPFTPKSDSHVSQVRVAVQYARGANQVDLSMYGDASGAPGTLLAGPVTVTNLPAQGTCCPLTVANFSPIAVTGGTQYWVVVDTPLTGTGSDFEGGWAWAVPTLPYAANTGSGWATYASNSLAAGEVLGTIP
jgi:hypothetical protein